MSRVRPGLDVCLGWLKGERPRERDRRAAELLRGGRLGFVTNPSAVTADVRAAPDALLAAGAKVVSLFGPEHGVRGEVADGIRIPHGKDERTGLPVWSLYGEQIRPTPEMLNGLDALVFDLQDVGSRFYTFSATLSNVMSGAAASHLPVIILDRPNPLGRGILEGPVLEPALASFVGPHPIPIRHGATMGELGMLWAGYGAGEPPLVVRCEGLQPRMRWEETALPWVPPSPAMPTVDTARVYPGMCLIEGTNVSEARGTSCPFLWFGAPWVKAEALAEALNAEGLPGVRFRPVRFKPTASKHLNITCEGCQLHLVEPREFLPVAAGVAVLTHLRRLPEFAWRQFNGRYSVDRLAGTASLRTGVDAGKSWKTFAGEWRESIRKYREQLDSARLYG